MSLTFDQYGKSRVRLVRVRHLGDRDEVTELTVDTRLEGDFQATYTVGDNTRVIPTDTQKNTVYVVAKQHGAATPEGFCVAMCKHFLEKYSWVKKAHVRAVQHVWSRLVVRGKPHPHAFSKSEPEVRIGRASQTRGSAPVVHSKMENFTVLKTTGSGFVGYNKCDLTTLPPTTDRMFCTAVQAEWRFTAVDEKTDFDGVYARVKEVVGEQFAEKYSKSVQQTLHDVGVEVCKTFPNVAEINIVMPNIHINIFDIARFGLENKNEVYVPLSDPSGYLEATISQPPRAKL